MGVHNNPQTLICRPDMQVSTYTISPQEFIRSELDRIHAEMELKEIQAREEKSQRIPFLLPLMILPFQGMLPENTVDVKFQKCALKAFKELDESFKQIYY